jgi:hypothetical protein
MPSDPQAPDERPLTDEEHAEIADAAQAALDRFDLDPASDPYDLVASLEAQLVARRMVKGDHGELVFEAGALFAHGLAGPLEWEMLELTWPSLSAVAVTPFDRSLVILPFLAVDQALQPQAPPDPLARTMRRLLDGDRPTGLRRNGYAVVLP